MLCPKFSEFEKFIRSYDVSAEMDASFHKDLRVDIWGTNDQTLADLFTGGIDTYTGSDESQHVKRKLTKSLERIEDAEGTSDASSFIRKMIASKSGTPVEGNVQRMIALHELFETVKGESDKAVKKGIDPSTISNQTLPAVVKSRLASSIGRKIAYQLGYVFQTDKANKVNAESVEQLYFVLGDTALRNLEQKGYVKFHDNVPVIKDFYTSSELTNRNYRESMSEEVTTSPSVSINETAFGIKEGNQEQQYFLNRTEADLENTQLGTITEILRVVRNITQPSNMELPDTNTGRVEDLGEFDNRKIDNSDTLNSAREKLYKAPLRVSKPVHELLTLLNKEVQNTGKSASELIKTKFKNHKDMLNDLFGFRQTFDTSVDLKESVIGQNLSKTLPLNDLAEYYHELVDDNGDPADLHFILHNGRNGRLYYLATVLNAHSSKSSRYSLTYSGENEVREGSKEYNYLVYQLAEALGDDKLKFDHITGQTASKIDKALEDYERYKKATTVSSKLAELSQVAKRFPGVDYALLLSTMEGISELRTPINGTVVTNFMTSADATASGGSLTLLQALGTNPAVKQLLQRIGILKNPNNEAGKDLADFYGFMSETIEKYLKGERIEGLVGQDLEDTQSGARKLLQTTLDLLFDEGGKIRDLSKDPTMTFVYGQGKDSAINSMATNLAQKIMDSANLDSTKQYLAELFNDKSYTEKFPSEIREERGGYHKVVEKLSEEGGVAETLYELMDASINDAVLKDYKNRSTAVMAFINKLPKKIAPRILPPSAVIDGIKPTTKNLKKYGIPLSSLVNMYASDQAMLRKEHRSKTVMDVSAIHAIDSALLYHAIDRVMEGKSGEKGAVVVHDDYRSSPAQVMAVEEEYRKLTQEIMGEYDVHEQVMLAVAAYSSEISNLKAYKKLMGEIQQNITEKKDILNNDFNKETTALIGEGSQYQKFAEASNYSAPSNRSKNYKKKKPETTSNTLTTILEDLRKDSDVINDFLNSSNPAKFKKGKENKYYPKKDTIEVSGTDAGNKTGSITKPLDLSDENQRTRQKEIIEHEIIHASTVAYIVKALTDNSYSAARLDVQYLAKVVRELKNTLESGKDSDLAAYNSEAVERVQYIVNQDDTVVQVSELIAVMHTEPKIAAEIYSMLGKNVKPSVLKSRVEAFINKVRKWLGKISPKDLNEQIDIEKVYGAITRTVENGESFRQAKSKEHAKVLKNIHSNLGFGPDQKVVNATLRAMLSEKAERSGIKFSKNLHSLLQKYPAYNAVVSRMQGVYDESETLQSLTHAITASNINKSKKADILAAFAKVSHQRNELINNTSQQLHLALEGIDDSTKATIGRFVEQAPLHEYFLDENSPKTADEIDNEVNKLAAELPGAIKSDVEKLVNFNVNGSEVTPPFYNLEAKYPQSESDKNADVRKYYVLRAIQEIGANDFEKMLENQDLIESLKDATVANKLSASNHNGGKFVRDSLIGDYFKEHMDIRGVDEKNFSQYENGDNNDWKVLVEPTANSLGVVYREVIDSTDSIGAFTDIKTQSGDVNVRNEFKRYSNVAAAADGQYKLMLTQEQRNQLNHSKDFVQNLSHSLAHNIAIQDSQSIRDSILSSETHMEVNFDNQRELHGLIDSKTEDHPWLLKMDGIKYSELSDKVKAKYRPVRGAASNVNGFNKEVDLVRKDIAYWLLGGHSKSFFKDPKYKWMVRIAKDLVATAKINMVILNPAKIFRDNVSNTSYLGMRGADPVYITKQYNDIVKNFSVYQKLQEDLVKLKVKSISEPDNTNIQERIARIQEEVKKTSVGDLADKGFINSLGSSLIVRDADTLSGVQSDYHTALEYLLKKDGKKNYVSHFIQRLQNIGGNGEDFFSYLASKMPDDGLSKGVKVELDKVHDRLAKIRSDQDIVNYVTQYTSSPASEFVRVGANIADLTDVVAKETLYRHLTENEGMSPEKARLDVLESFPDYKENLPFKVKQLSDLGILMFPSFWMRIQRAIYRLAKDKPANLTTEMLMEEVVFDTDIDTILDANIWTKATSYGGLLHTPNEAIGLGSISPLL